uniref:trimeric intracellular cation channel family protein n=1 Tax=Nonomuraea pusilla TaxID=46177 RepID=UPI0007C7DB39|nr:TRIC cation channel family protein [Nonomuraea pusilla]
MRVETVTTALDLVGVFINSLLGGSVARRRELDLFGYVVIGVVSGLGGGLIRDVLLQHGPPLALTNPLYIPIALAGAGVAFLLKFTEREWNRLFYVLDAIALSVWAVAGAQRTLAAGLGWLPAILLGTITAVGGGATRDLLVQRVPAVFGGNGLYASVAALVAGLQVICSALGVPVVVATPVAVVAGTALRLVAYRRGWELPGGMEWEARDVLGKAVHPPRPRRDRRRGRGGERQGERRGDRHGERRGDRRRDEGD